MGNNSVFDDIGIGSSDLGLSKDPDDIAEENANKLKAAETATAETKKEAADTAFEKEDEDRKKAGSKSNNILTGGKGLSTEENITRRTLLGS